MAELVNEVKFDFSGAAQLAGHLQRAQRYSGLISKDMQDAMKAARDSRNQLIQSRIPGGIAGSGHPAGVGGGMSAAGQFAALAGAAAGGSAFFYRSTALANPAATQRFHDALDDMAAVIGHQLVPALREMTNLVRQFADFLASNPGAAKGIGYAAIGATGLGLAGLGFNAARGVYGGVRAGVGLAGRAFGYGGSAAGAGAGTTRAAQAAAAVQGMRSEEELAALARSARGRAAGNIFEAPSATAEAEAAEAELASLRAARAMPGPAATGRFARLGRIGRGIGRAGGPIGTALTALEIQSTNRPADIANLGGTGGSIWDSPLAQAVNLLTGRSPTQNLERAGLGGGSQAWQTFKNWASPFGIANDLSRRNGGPSLNPFDWSVNQTVSMKSFGAAAKPAEYQDILGSIMSMRQSIIQGGRDPMEDLATSAQTTANNTTALLEIERGRGNGSDRGTNR